MKFAQYVRIFMFLSVKKAEAKPLPLCIGVGVFRGENVVVFGFLSGEKDQPDQNADHGEKQKCNAPDAKEQRDKGLGGSHLIHGGEAALGAHVVKQREGKCENCKGYEKGKNSQNDPLFPHGEISFMA